jgi:hypothetical protein
MEEEKSKSSWEQAAERMVFVNTVDASLRIIGINGKKVNSTTRRVLLAKLGPNRLSFMTTLWLAPEEQWRISLKFTLEDIPIEAIGQIVLASKDYNWWEYEVELGPNPYTHKLIVRALNQRLLRNSPALFRIHQSYGRYMNKEGD